MKFLFKWFFTYWRWTWSFMFIVVLLWWWFSSGDTVTITEGEKAGEQVTEPGPESFITALIAVSIGIGLYRWRKGDLPETWLMVTALCIPLFLWGFWAINPEWYVEWRESRYFWWMILTAVALGWLSTHDSSSVASTARLGLLLLMAIAIGVGAYSKLNWSGRSDAGNRASSDVGHLPIDIFLPVMGQCESGNRQFDDEGNLVVNKEGSSALGMYGIMASLYEEDALKSDIDIRTAEGNRRYAEILYAKFGTKPWKASQDCWGPKVAHFLSVGEVEYTVHAEPKKWTGNYRFPVGMMVDINAESLEGRFAIKTRSGTYSFTPEKSDAVPGAIPFAQFLALGDSPEQIHVRIYKK